MTQESWDLKQKLEGKESFFFTHTTLCGNVTSWCKSRLLQIKDKMKLLQSMYIEPLTYNQMVSQHCTMCEHECNLTLYQQDTEKEKHTTCQQYKN